MVARADSPAPSDKSAASSFHPASCAENCKSGFASESTLGFQSWLGLLLSGTKACCVLPRWLHSWLHTFIVAHLPQGALGLLGGVVTQTWKGLFSAVSKPVFGTKLSKDSFSYDRSDKKSLPRPIIFRRGSFRAVGHSGTERRIPTGNPKERPSVNLLADSRNDRCSDILDL